MLNSESNDMLTKSKFQCPVCKQPLTIAANGSEFPILLYCAYGPCCDIDKELAIMANEGETGKTEAEAFSKLESALDQITYEREYNTQEQTRINKHQDSN